MWGESPGDCGAPRVAEQITTLCLQTRKWARKRPAGAHIRDRTGDLSLTKTVLYLLSYVGLCEAGCMPVAPVPRLSSSHADACAPEGARTAV